MQRILVVGDSCSGKSSLAEGLAAHLRIPVVELDALNWKPGWQASAPDELREKVREATAGTGWILVGNYSVQHEVSWPRADTVVWLDLPLRVLLARSFARSWRRWRTGELLWGTNRESFLRQLKLWDEQESLARWTWNHHAPIRERYEAAMRDPRFAHLRWHRFASNREAEAWLSSLR